MGTELALPAGGRWGLAPVSTPPWNTKGGAAETALPCKTSSHPFPDKADLFLIGHGGRQPLESVTYAARLEHWAVGARLAFAEAGAEAEGGRGPRQLEFDFFAEAQRTELRLLAERGARVANQAEGARRERFVEMSRAAALRFSVTAELSGSALRGFASGAEAAQAGGAAVFDRFLDAADAAFERSREALNEVFELLDGWVNGLGRSLRDQFAALLAGFADRLGDVLTDGGASVGGGVTVQLTFSFEFSATAVAGTDVVQQSDPVTLDLDGDGIELTHHADGARFDITGSGRKASTAFVTGGDAFLAIDRNGNGRIDDGTELFGDQRGAANGFEELRRLDTNRDGVVDARDADYEALLLFRDNGNGRTEEGELLTLRAGGVASISLDYHNVNERAAGGNRIAQTAWFKRHDGSTGRAADVILNYTA